MDTGKKTAFQFIILFGVVSLFGDMTYEGARSITGPYLALLGASAAVVGLVAGFGEFMGYALRLASGYLADRTERYWLITIIGYALLLSIPLLAFVGYWELAALLVILERMGKAIRTPSRDTMLSHATKQLGRGWGFGIHEALDQVGAIIGPLTLAAVFLLKGGYPEAFTILWVPAFLTLVILMVARFAFPSPEKFEASERTTGRSIKGKGRLSKVFWFYVLFTFLSVMGFAHFQLISYHLKVQSVLPDVEIPIFYAIAMGVDALVALGIGKTYDKIGLISLATVPLLSLPIPFLAFSHSYALAIIGVILWGAVMGIQETIMRAAVADLTPAARRGVAYGIFNTAYGASWFLGSTFMGLLYEIGTGYLILFVVMATFISVPILFLVNKQALSAKL